MINNSLLKALIEELDNPEFDCPKNADDDGCWKKCIKEALLELKERRESDLRPATKFVNTTCEGFKRQLDHVKSEITEIEEAFETYMKCGGAKRLEELTDEITDAQSSLQTLKADVNVAGELDKESCRRVAKKNAARGYYGGCS